MKIKFFLTYFLFFLLSLFFFFSLISGFFSFFITKENFMTIMNSENYISKVSLSIREEMEGLLQSSGFDSSLLDALFTEENIQNEIEKKVDLLSFDKSYVVETDYLKQNLKTNIEQYLKTNGLSADEEAIEKFILQISSVYENELSLYQTAEIIFKTLRTLKKYLFYSFMIFLVLFVTGAIFSWKQLHKNVFSFSCFTYSSLNAPFSTYG